MHRFLKALRLVEKLNDEAASDEFSTSRSILTVTHLDKAVLSSQNEQGVLLYIEAAAPHTLGQRRCKQQWPRLGVLCHLTFPRVEKYARYRTRKIFVELRRTSAH